MTPSSQPNSRDLDKSGKQLPSSSRPAEPVKALLSGLAAHKDELPAMQSALRRDTMATDRNPTPPSLVSVSQMKLCVLRVDVDTR